MHLETAMGQCVQYLVKSVYCTHTVHSKLYSVHCRQYTVQCALYTVLLTIYCTLNTLCRIIFWTFLYRLRVIGKNHLKSYVIKSYIVSNFLNLFWPNNKSWNLYWKKKVHVKHPLGTKYYALLSLMVFKNGKTWPN